jgi:hypothetical protein
MASMVPATQTRALDIVPPSQQRSSKRAEAADVHRDALGAFAEPATRPLTDSSLLHVQNCGGGQAGYSEFISGEELAQAIADQGAQLSFSDASCVVDGFKRKGEMSAQRNSSLGPFAEIDPELRNRIRAVRLWREPTTDKDRR